MTPDGEAGVSLAKLKAYLRIDPEAALPLSGQLYAQIAWLIASGTLREGDQLPSVRGLARELGINMHTVRSAYQELMRRGLVDSRPGRGTSVRALDGPEVVLDAPDFPSFTLGVVIPGLDPFYSPFLNAIEQSLRDEPSLLFVANSHDDPALAYRYSHQLMAKGVDGLILASTSLGSRALTLTRAMRRPPPIVWVDDPEAPRHRVLLDSRGAGRMATAHLLEHGHDRIALITAPIEWPNVHECYLGYRDALEAELIEADPDLVFEVPRFSLQAGAEAAQLILASAQPPTAIYAAGDLLAIGAIRAIKAAGLSVPGDCAVVGYADIEMAAFVDPALTTVRAPASQMGIEALSMLRLLRAREPVPSEQVVLETELVIRRSCGCEHQLAA